MKTLVSSWLLFSSLVALTLSIAVFSQAEGSTQDENPSMRPALRERRALGPFTIFDSNHDGIVSAEEIANAPAVLKALDKNGDGKLTTAELRTPGTPPPPPRRDE